MTPTSVFLVWRPSDTDTKILGVRKSDTDTHIFLVSKSDTDTGNFGASSSLVQQEGLDEANTTADSAFFQIQPPRVKIHAKNYFLFTGSCRGGLLAGELGKFPDSLRHNYWGE